VTVASLTGVGSTTIGAGSTLDVTGTVAPGETIVLAAPDAVLKGPRARVLDLEAKAPLEGFHAFEAGEGIRWTDGDALLPGHLFDGLDGGFDLELRLGGRTQYIELPGDRLRLG
jgi:hypothetical protein